MIDCVYAWKLFLYRWMVNLHTSDNIELYVSCLRQWKSTKLFVNGVVTTRVIIRGKNKLGFRKVLSCAKKKFMPKNSCERLKNTENWVGSLPKNRKIVGHSGLTNLFSFYQMFQHLPKKYLLSRKDFHTESRSCVRVVGNERNSYWMNISVGKKVEFHRGCVIVLLMSNKHW